MNKNIYKTLLLLSVIFISCNNEKTSEGVSRVTYFPDMIINGDPITLVNTGDSFTDEGCVAMSGEVELETNSETSKGRYNGGELDTNIWDLHTVTYTAFNDDGFPGTATREVWIGETGDLTTDISGYYLSSTERGSSESYEDLVYISIQKTGANTYKLSDALGGYYDLGREYYNYGDIFRATGAVITVNNLATNDFSITDADLNNDYWGSNPFSVNSFVVDASTNTITFTASGFSNFNVTLTQVQF